MLHIMCIPQRRRNCFLSKDSERDISDRCPFLTTLFFVPSFDKTKQNAKNSKRHVLTVPHAVSNRFKNQKSKHAVFRSAPDKTKENRQKRQ